MFIVIAISKLLRKFSDNFYVRAAIYGLKPASCALISAVALRLMKSTLVNIPEMMIFLGLLYILFTRKKTPIFYLVVSGLIGLVLYFVVKVKQCA